MKRLLSLFLSLALLCALALPASAAAADERLTQVTLKVKQTLDIGNEYESFSGDLQEGLRPYWSLRWTKGDEELHVVADETGKIYQYYRYSSGSVSSPSSDSVPTLPTVSRTEAQKAAQAFLDRVLTDGESAVFDEGTDRPGTTSYYLSGSIRLNDLPSPFTFSVDVSASDGTVQSFSRSDLDQPFEDGVPAPDAAVSAADAGDKLPSTLALRLEYVLDGDSDTAVLRYLPDHSGQFYVDAATGELIDLSALYENVGNGSDSATGGESGVAPDKGEEGLSEAEQAGIAKLEGVQSKEKLDSLLRAQKALGLNGAQLSYFAYTLDEETDQVSASLRYTRSLDEGFWTRNITVDARTGEILSLYSSRPYEEDAKAAVTQQQAQATAEAFLKNLWGEEFAQCALYGSSDGQDYTFRYAQKVNGYFFPDNYLYVSVDAADGTISHLSKSYDPDVTFDSADGLISAEAAMDAYFGAYTVTLGYLAVPTALDPNAPEVAPLLNRGYSYVFALTLGYTLETERSIRGVDAKTGEVLYPQTHDRSITYDDLEGCWGKQQALTLAQYSVGWRGGSLRPYEALTQLDLVALLASSRGYFFDPAQDDVDSLYEYAYRTGILTPDQRDDSAPVTRLELVKLLLDGAGYGPVARLEGIYRCDYTDAAAIPAADLGYAALAQGLGLVAGDSAGRFAPDRTATRIEAIAVLYQYMTR